MPPQQCLPIGLIYINPDDITTMFGESKGGQNKMTGRYTLAPGLPGEFSSPASIFLLLRQEKPSQGRGPEDHDSSTYRF